MNGWVELQGCVYVRPVNKHTFYTITPLNAVEFRVKRHIAKPNVPPLSDVIGNAPTLIKAANLAERKIHDGS